MEALSAPKKKKKREEKEWRVKETYDNIKREKKEDLRTEIKKKKKRTIEFRMRHRTCIFTKSAQYHRQFFFFFDAFPKNNRTTVEEKKTQNTDSI